MAYKRKRTYVPRSNKRARRVYRRRIPRRTANGGNRGTTYITRHCTYTSVAGSDTVPTFGAAYTFSLGQLPSYTEFTNLYDRYTVTSIKYRWYIDTDPMVVSATGKKFFPRINWVHDFTDSSTPGSKNELEQYPRKREVFLSENRQSTRWFTLKPATLASEYQGVGSTGYSPKWRQFLSTADYNVPHYGLKLYVEQLFAGVTLVMETKYVLGLKNPK